MNPVRKDWSRSRPRIILHIIDHASRSRAGISKKCTRRVTPCQHEGFKKSCQSDSGEPLVKSCGPSSASKHLHARWLYQWGSLVVVLSTLGIQKQHSRKMCTFEAIFFTKCGHLARRCYLECHAAKLSGQRCEERAQKERPLTIKERGPTPRPEYCDECKSDGFLAWF